MNRRILAVLLILGALMTSALVANALVWNSGSLTLTCTGFVNNGGFATADRDNTGNDTEAYWVEVVDGNGTVLYYFEDEQSTGFAGPWFSDAYDVAPDYNPITFTFGSFAGNGLPEQIGYTVTGNCDGLPTYDAGPGCQLAVPSGSVVGEAPNGAQVYYAPGQATNVTLNPGTYLVVGQDASETYYKVVLACQYVWVRKDAMQPSYQAPQNGAPLPTRVVS